MSARQDLAAAVKAALFDKIEWRPVSIAPEDGQVSVVCNRVRSAAAVFKGGEWVTERGKPLKFTPTHYMVFKDAP